MLGKFTGRFFLTASVLAVSIASPSASWSAGLDVTTPSATQVITSPYDYVTLKSTIGDGSNTVGVNINSATAQITGDVTNEGTISATGTGLLVISGAGVGGNVVNEGTITVSGSANSYGIALQELGSAIFNNSGILTVTDEGDKTAFASGVFLSANATGDPTGIASFTNSGTLSVTASAAGTNAAVDQAFASAQGGVVDAYGADTVTSLMSNSGSISVTADASVTSLDALATASAYGFYQTPVQAGGAQTSASASLTNSGSLTITAEAFAGQPSGSGTPAANATANAVVDTGFAQSVLNAADSAAAFTNNGTFGVLSDATARADQAKATSLLTAGITQSVAGSGTKLANINNSDTITLEADALASGTSSATAEATAAGIYQGVSGGTARLTNTGSITIAATARAQNAATASASASVLGIEADGGSGTLSLDHSNTDSISVTAIAEGADSASATATGLLVEAGNLSGVLTNSGLFSVHATAVGGTASAVGVVFEANTISATLTNTGTIKAIAEGSSGKAVAIELLSAGSPSGSGPATIVNNGGTITASFDDGTETRRGTAIDVSQAPTPVVIELRGSTAGGNIFGDIRMGSGDSIVANNGNTYLDGSINPGGNTGSLTVASGGALWLQHGGSVNGPSIAKVSSFTQESDGTLAIGVAADGTNSQINAGTVTLAGNLVINPLAGDYAATTSYEDIIISSSAISGDWVSIVSNSPLFSVNVLNNGQDIDLTLTRLAFTDTSGLSGNQEQVASAVESAFDSGVDGTPFGDIVNELYTLDASGYAAALDNLSGVAHAVVGEEFMQSFRALDDIVPNVRGRQCGSDGQAAVTKDERSGSADYTAVDCHGASFWMRGQGLFAKATDNGDSPGFDGTTVSLYGGADYALAPETVLGVLVGYVNSSLNFEGGADASYDAIQIGLYGQQSWDQAYVRALVAYGNAAVDVDRNISVGAITGDTKSDYHDNAWYAGGEIGYDYRATDSWIVTPFAGLSYAGVDSDDINESGLDGANLDGSIDGYSLVSSIGARFTADFNGYNGGIFRPELSLAWEHEFGDFTSFDAEFAGVPASGFTVTGGDYGRNAAVVDFGMTYAAQSIELTLNYSGRWLEDYNDQSVYGQFRYIF